jgi:hypothetical protein
MKTLTQLGFRRKQNRTIADFFGVQVPAAKPHTPDPPIKPDTDYHPDPPREPQAPGFAGVWIDEFSNIGNIKNPLGSAME